MSAQDQMRAMLDQLMGTSRNGEANKYNYKFTDSIVCKSFLLACCPHEILSSTRMDLGDCPKVHDLALRADYEKASKTKDFFYDIDSMEHLQSFISDCDRRTEASKKRLAETQEELSAEVAAKANKVHDLAEQIGKKLAKAEQIGTEGSVEESMKLMEEVEDLRKKKAAAEQEYRNSMPASSYQQQKLRVCEVCSAYLGIHDNDRRLADHFGGKLHLGFIKIREKLEDLKATVESRREKRQEDREKQRNRRYNDEDLDAERDRSGRYNNYHSRGGDRRDRYRDEDRRHKRSRSKERRHRRSKSRDKNDKSRSSESRDGRYGENRKPGPNPAHGSHYSDRDFVLDQLINPEQPEPRKRRSRSGEGSRGHKHTHSHSHSRSHERSRSQDRKSWSRSRDISKSRDAIEAGEV